jgi:hypothetical protein
MLAGTFYDKSNPIGESDILIAGITLSNKQTVIARNKRHFERVLGLQVEGLDSSAHAHKLAIPRSTKKTQKNSRRRAWQLEQFFVPA